MPFRLRANIRFGIANLLSPTAVKRQRFTEYKRVRERLKAGRLSNRDRPVLRWMQVSVPSAKDSGSGVTDGKIPPAPNTSEYPSRTPAQHGTGRAAAAFVRLPLVNRYRRSYCGRQANRPDASGVPSEKRLKHPQVTGDRAPSRRLKLHLREVWVGRGHGSPGAAATMSAHAVSVWHAEVLRYSNTPFLTTYRRSNPTPRPANVSCVSRNAGHIHRLPRTLGECDVSIPQLERGAITNIAAAVCG